jgi:tetratricopeptide (TPR) repeat protein
MKDPVVTVSFSRDDKQEDVELDPKREYRVRVDGGPRSTFHAPWTQSELGELIDDLRNVGGTKPTIERAKEIGRALGERVFEIKGLERHLLRDGEVTVCWQLDYPELARIPWELTTTNQRPYRHLLLRRTSFTRKVPALMQDAPAQWPTGRDETLRLLYVWGERTAGEVPRKDHLKALRKLCTDCGVDLKHQEIVDIKTLSDLCRDTRYHFVHVLAHGAAADNDEWGLRLKNGVVKGEQVARALTAGGTTPAVVTLAACDSANEHDNSFGSVAYQLHMYGVPLVVASQFRLRKTVSVVSAEEIYSSILSGGDFLSAMRDLRLKLAGDDNESWANEVIYSRYRQESLDELSTVARQQGALRRARRFEKESSNAAHRPGKAIDALREEVEKLIDLLDEQEMSDPRVPAAEAETCGLLGSLHQRIAKLRSSPPDPEDLRRALSYYERGLRADANSHYCGINVVNLRLRLGDRDRAMAVLPVVRFVAESEILQGLDYWAHATAGDLEVYAGRAQEAQKQYRKFVEKVEDRFKGKRKRVETFGSSHRPLSEMPAIFVGPEHDDLRKAAAAALNVLDSAIRRNS